MSVPAVARPRDAVGGVLVLGSATLFGLVVILGRFTARSRMPVPGILAIRFALCALVLAIVLVALRRPLLPARGERVGHLAVGIAGYAVEATFFFTALRHGNAAPVTLLFYTHPVFVTMVSWVLGRGRPNRLALLTLVLGVGGAAIVVVGSGDLSIAPLGAIFALCSAVTYTGYILAAERVVRGTEPLVSSLWISAAAAFGLGVFAFATGRVRAPAGWEDWWPILGMAAATAVAFFCLFAGLGRLGAVRTSIVSSSEPLAAAALAAIFLGESIGPPIAVGGVCIVAGAVIASLARLTPPPEPPGP